MPIKYAPSSYDPIEEFTDDDSNTQEKSSDMSNDTHVSESIEDEPQDLPFESGIQLTQEVKKMKPLEIYRRKYGKWPNPKLNTNSKPYHKSPFASAAEDKSIMDNDEVILNLNLMAAKFVKENFKGATGSNICIAYKSNQIEDVFSLTIRIPK
jgi:hypothetical protein